MYPKVLSLHFEYKVREVLGESVTTDWLRALVLEFYFWLLFVVITQLKKEIMWSQGCILLGLCASLPSEIPLSGSGIIKM